MIYLDSNVVIWLAGGARHMLSPFALEQVTTATALRISPMVTLELQYLHEVGRLTHPSGAVLERLTGALNITECDHPFAQVINTALTFDWTRDPFDRLITAQAAISGDILLTKDHTIRANYAHARW